MASSEPLPRKIFSSATPLILLICFSVQPAADQDSDCKGHYMDFRWRRGRRGHFCLQTPYGRNCKVPDSRCSLGTNLSILSFSFQKLLRSIFTTSRFTLLFQTVHSQSHRIGMSFQLLIFRHGHYSISNVTNTFFCKMLEGDFAIITVQVHSVVSQSITMGW